jgi:hypothetical protein
MHQFIHKNHTKLMNDAYMCANGAHHTVQNSPHARMPAAEQKEHNAEELKSNVVNVGIMLC